MAAQSSLREELKILRRKAWERRNQEVLQEKETDQETTPLFGEPIKKKKSDELSILIQKLLGNYENGNTFQYSQYDVLSKDPSLGYLPGGRGSSAHKGKVEPMFSTSSPHGGSKHGHPRHGSSHNFKKHPSLNTSSTIDSKDPPVQPHPRTSDSWSDARDNPGLPHALPDLSPLQRPLSPLHSSDSSDSEQDAVHNYDGSLSPEGNNGHSLSLEHANNQSFSPEVNSSLGSSASTGLLETQLKETSGDAPIMAPQTFPPPLSSKPSLANSKKPMALVRPLDGPDQVISESPDLKPSPDDFLRQSYENLSDLKNSSKPSLPPLKMPSQPVEVLSNDVQRVDEILKEMTYSCPPLLTAIQTPSTAEPSKFPFPIKQEAPVPSGYQQSQKQQEPSPKAPAVAEPAVCVSTASTLAPPSGGESTSSSDSESSSESESDDESGTEETPPASSTHTPPAKVEGLKDNWDLSNFIRGSKQSPNPQNQEKGLKHSTKPQTEEKPKPRNKKRHNSQSKSSDAHVEEKAAKINQHANPKPASDSSISVENRTTMAADKPRGKTSKPHSSLLVESVEVTPRDKDATFRERPKAKTEFGHKSKSESGKSSTVKKEGKDECPAKAISDRKEAETKRSLNVKSPSTKTSKKGRDRSPKTKRRQEKAPKVNGEQSLALVVKIKLSQLTRIPKVGTKIGTGSHLVEPLMEEKQITRVGKKRPAEHAEQTPPKKKLKLEKDGKSAASSQCHRSGRTETKKSSRENKDKEKERKSSKKDPPAHPPTAEGSGHKKRSADVEESSKSKKKSREEHGKNKKKTVRIGSSGPESNASTVTPPTKRPLLKVDHKLHSVDHHLLEAKKLKHKADAMPQGDKMSKALSYLDAAMSFVESGIAMEMEPQTPKSAYTMFSDTVDLIRFILKLKNYLDPSAPASERDFFVLCMRCKALLQMAMFRCNRDSALDYCRTLTDYFKSSRTVKAPSPCVAKITSPGSPMPSPASSVSSNPGGMSSSTVSIPQLVQQMASSYINITSLFLSAHETWEQAEELARTRTGLLNELDVAVGRLSLTSSMSSLVRYTRQGLHWLQLDSLLPRPGPCA